MPNKAYITTSWDDGNPLDFRIAELLSRFGLTGTFYIPREASTGVMSESQVAELSRSFEIGAHTMRHVFLDSAADSLADREIVDSRTWVQDVTGKPCPMFCPPGGKFRPIHLKKIEAAGFDAIRTVELMSLGWPRATGKLLMMPTTLQAHPHSPATYARNIIKRRALGNLWQFVVHGRAPNWEALARSMATAAARHGGVFHLWGHSWEIEQNAQWTRLESVLRFLGELTPATPCVTNGELCEIVRRPDTSIEKLAG